MSGAKFLKEKQVRDKNIGWIFFPIHIYPVMNDSNSRINKLWGSKIYEWVWGAVYDWGKVS